MKTLLLFISLVLITPQLQATIDVSPISGTKKIAITLSELSSHAKIELLDQQGIILTSTKVKSINYQSIFDLTVLPEGKYFLSIQLGTKEWVNFDEISGEYKNKYNFQFPSPNDFNYSYESIKEVMKIYRKNY